MEIALSLPSGTLWVQWARQGPDGRWDLVDPDEIPYQFCPWDGTWGYGLWSPIPGTWWISRMEADGAEPWRIPLPVEHYLSELPARVDPDGRLRALGWIVEPDGSLCLDPLGWPEEAIPGPAGSWLTRDGVQRFPDGGTRRWIAREAASDLQPLWIGRWGDQEVVLARQGHALLRISRPEGDPEPLTAGTWEIQVFPDGRWIAWGAKGSLLLGDPGGIRAESPSFPEIPFIDRARPLHEGVLVPPRVGIGTMGDRIWRARSSGELEELPPVHWYAWTDCGPWRVWHGLRGRNGRPSMAIRRGGSPIYQLPPIEREDLWGDWARADRRLIRFPPESLTPQEVPLPAPLQGKEWTLVGALGEQALAIAPRDKGTLGLFAIRPDGSWREWAFQARIAYACRGHTLTLEKGRVALIFLQPGMVLLLAGDRVIQAPGPEWDERDDLAGAEIRMGPSGFLVGIAELGEAFLVDPEAPAIQRLRAL